MSFFHGSLLGRIAFSFCCDCHFTLHYILWRYCLTNGVGDGDPVNLHVLFWLAFTEISIMMQTGINTLSSSWSPRSGVRCSLTPQGSVSACVSYFGYRTADFGLAYDDRNFSHCASTLFCDSVLWTLCLQGLPWRSVVCAASASAAANPSAGPCVSREGRKWWTFGSLVYVSNCR